MHVCVSWTCLFSAGATTFVTVVVKSACVVKVVIRNSDQVNFTNSVSTIKNCIGRGFDFLPTIRLLIAPTST